MENPYPCTNGCEITESERLTAEALNMSADDIHTINDVHMHSIYTVLNRRNERKNS